MSLLANCSLARARVRLTSLIRRWGALASPVLSSNRLAAAHGAQFAVSATAAATSTGAARLQSLGAPPRAALPMASCPAATRHRKQARRAPDNVSARIRQPCPMLTVQAGKLARAPTAGFPERARAPPGSEGDEADDNDNKDLARPLLSAQAARAWGIIESVQLQRDGAPS